MLNMLPLHVCCTEMGLYQSRPSLCPKVDKSILTNIHKLFETQQNINPFGCPVNLLQRIVTRLTAPQPWKWASSSSAVDP